MIEAAAIPFLTRAYLLETCSPEEARSAGASLGDWLSAREWRCYLDLSTPKRRRDWLSGRVAAKKAAKKFLAALGHSVSTTLIEISNDSERRPLCRVAEPVSLEISISHAPAGGLCALTRAPARIGVDWETVALIPRPVLNLVLHEKELTPALLTSAPEQTRIWTLKEAVLKFLGKGLALNPREVLIPGEARSPQLSGEAARLWKTMGAPRIHLETLSHGDSLIGLAYSS